MPTPLKYKAPLFAELPYHLIFRTVDGVQLFREPFNKVFFRRKYKYYLNPMLSTLANNLMENHAHFIVKVKSIKGLRKSISRIPEEKRTKTMKAFMEAEDPTLLVNPMILRQINSFLVSYAMAYNIFYNRKGGMFHSPCRRVAVKDAKHLKHGIVYVNANAQKHHLVDDFKTYPDTTYHDVIANSSSLINVKLVLDFFGGREEFIKSHEQIVAFYYSSGWQFESLPP